MVEPPRDDDGFVKPHNDPDTIPDDALLLRSIPAEWLLSQDGVKIVSKAAFSASGSRRDRYRGMSVSVVDWLVQDGKPLSDALQPDHPAGAVLRAGDLRKLGLDVGPDPQDDNKYHAGVWGVKDSHRKKILKQMQRLIRREED